MLIARRRYHARRLWAASVAERIGLRMSELAILGGKPVIAEPFPAYNSIGVNERQAAMDVIDSGCLSRFYGSPGPEFFGGPEVQALEGAWQQRYGIAHAVSVNSATSGLVAAMGAIGLSPGDEVIVPPYTMSATVVAPLAYGGIPVFVDIEPDFFCLDYDKVVEAITPHTRAILAVNLFGHPATLARLRQLADERGIYLVEDNAQAPLAQENRRLCGTIGHIGIFSLNYHKHIHAGEGGICVTDDRKLFERLAMIRNHGENVAASMAGDDLVNTIGFNLRLTEISAAIARRQLQNIDLHVQRREKVAQILCEGTTDLAGLIPPKVRAGCRHNFYMWTMRCDDRPLGISRDLFAKALAAEGFPNEVGYCEPLYKLPVFQKRIAIGRKGFPFNLSNRTYPQDLCPVAERMWSKEVVQYQPPSWHVDEAGAAMLVEAVRKVHRCRSALRALEAA
jgi:perosamine synthetase